MASRSDNRYRLQRDGASQSTRQLAALDPATAPVDERDVADFLVFAKRLARILVYRDLKNQDDGDWEAFFGCDPSTVIAAIKKTNPEYIRESVGEILKAGEPSEEGLNELFGYLLSLARLLDDWYQGVGEATDFRLHIGKRINANLPVTLAQLIGFNRASAERFAGVSFFVTDYTAFSAVWSVDQSESPDPYAIPSDDSLFGAFGADQVSEQLKSAYKKTEELFATLYRVLLSIIGLAPRYFARDLVGRHDHEPHYALFVAFLRLYGLLQRDANQLTQRHLDFFYQKVLGIETRPAVPDQLHVLVELARQVKDTHAVEDGVELDAGKDETGVPLRYQLDNQLVANKAQIEQFKTIFVDQGKPPSRCEKSEAEQVDIYRVHAAPKANSQDGKGGEFIDPDRPSWPTLGSRYQTRCPEATIGFAVGSRTLQLAEGQRSITLTLEAEGFRSGLTEGDWKTILDGEMEVKLSGEKGWVPVSAENLTVSVADLETSNDTAVTSGILQIGIDLASTDEAVTFPKDAKALGLEFGVTEPLLRVALCQSSPEKECGKATYGLLKGLRLTRISLDVSVEGVTNVIVQNDQFVMDPSKPFEPFGFSPKVGSNFYVGCPEAFQKDLLSLSLHLKWDDLPSPSVDFSQYYLGYDSQPNNDQFKVRMQLLQDGTWQPPKVEGDSQLESLFDGDEIEERTFHFFDFFDSPNQKPKLISEVVEWTQATQQGFLRLSLEPKDFLHDKYVQVLTRQSVAAGRLPKCTPGAWYKNGSGQKPCNQPPTDDLTGNDWVVIIPEAPYTPKVKEFKIDYCASINSDVIDKNTDSDVLSLFHIEPFGYASVPLAFMSQDEGQESGQIVTPALLPQYDHEGSLLLGIRDLKPLQGLSILIQMSEGTADTDVEAQEIQWSYLKNNEWENFDKSKITEDTTKSLTTSGIVTFSIPRDINSDNTRLPSGLYWLRAAVDSGAGAVSELINAHTQAVSATFVDGGNDSKHYEAPLPPESIGGLVRADSKVASVIQPYASVGGRQQESGLAFYTRVSEYLRHKGRSITIFDYERIILENFPTIYKAKCINHTNGDDELAPGHVLIALIPDFRQLKAVDRQKPKVTLAELKAISAFLKKKNCPFVDNDRNGQRKRLHVVNPVYEYIQVGFDVRFNPEVAGVEFHREKLREEINRFLSPWAYMDTDTAEISFGGKVFKSSILHLVEQQDYVDYVTDFQMTHRDGCSYQPGTEQEIVTDFDVIEAITPRSILVPVLAEDHRIDLIDDLTGCNSSSAQNCPEVGIGKMAIGDDFEISRSDVH